MRGANAAYQNAMLVALVVSAALSALGTFAASPLCRLLGANDTFFSMTRDYLFWYSVFIIPSGLSTAMQGFVRNDGDPILVSAGIIAGTLLNIAGDWLLIFPLGMGLKGAAIATGVSQTVSLVIILFHFAKKSARLHLFNAGVPLRGKAASGRAFRGFADAPLPTATADAATTIPNAGANPAAMEEKTGRENALGGVGAAKPLRSNGAIAEPRNTRPRDSGGTPKGIISWSLIAEILLRGFPECVAKFATPVATFCMNYVLLARVGNVAVNAFSVISYVASFSVAIFFGTAEGLQPLFGHCYGARNVRSLHWYFRAGLLINVAGSVVINLLLMVLGGPICALFGVDEATYLYTMQTMPIYAWGFVAVAVSTIVTTYFYSTTRTAKAVGLNAMRAFVFTPLVTFGLPLLFGDGAIWWSFLVYEAIIASIALVMMRTVD